MRRSGALSRSACDIISAMGMRATPGTILCTGPGAAVHFMIWRLCNCSGRYPQKLIVPERFIFEAVIAPPGDLVVVTAHPRSLRWSRPIVDIGGGDGIVRVLLQRARGRQQTSPCSNQNIGQSASSFQPEPVLLGEIDPLEGFGISQYVLMVFRSPERLLL